MLFGVVRGCCLLVVVLVCCLVFIGIRVCLVCRQLFDMC